MSEVKCAPWPVVVPEKWDRETDVLILGAGIGGACAAVEAFDLGAKVLVLEKSNEIRGACALSGGSLCGAGTRHQKENGIEDDVEVMIADFMAAGGEMGDPDIIRAFAELSGETIDWLEDLGCEILPGCRPSPGIHTIRRNHNSAPEGNGVGWMIGLERAIKKRGIEVLFETAATKLYRDESGRVVGAEGTTKDGKTLAIKATKGVLVATGGIGCNMEMWAQYSPVMKDIVKKSKKVVSSYPRHIAGDGLPMLHAAGAYMYPSQALYGSGSTETAPGPAQAVSVLPHRWSELGAIEVNAEGKRFCNETTFQDFYIAKKFKYQPGMWYLMVFDDKTRTTRQGQLYAQRIIDVVTGNGHNSVQKADTIEELAEKFGIPAEELRKTVDEWNGLIEAGQVDPYFGRTKMGGKIEVPPFWGIELVVSVGTSKCGAKINTKAQVIDRDDHVIPGLYAAGETASFQVMGDARTHVSGGCNGGAANFGRIAVRNMVKEEPWA